jgi:hypothetical protein
VKPSQIVTLNNNCVVMMDLAKKPTINPITHEQQHFISKVLIKNANKGNDEVTFLKVNSYNTRYLMIGYKSGLVEIVDVKEPEKTILELKKTDKAIKDLKFMSDLYYGTLAVVTDCGTIEIYILKHN